MTGTPCAPVMIGFSSAGTSCIFSSKLDEPSQLLSTGVMDSESPFGAPGAVGLPSVTLSSSFSRSECNPEHDQRHAHCSRRQTAG